MPEAAIAQRSSSRRKTVRPRWIFLIARAHVFYDTGASFIESFVSYPSSRLALPEVSIKRG